MFRDWFLPEAKKIGFEDMKHALRTIDTIIINTLPHADQTCLIQGTIPAGEEEETINRYIENGLSITKRVVVYGKHSCDNTAPAKCKQLQSLGFGEVYYYVGGLFEWLLLQDVYGEKEFPTTSKTLDILKYRSPKTW